MGKSTILTTAAGLGVPSGTHCPPPPLASLDSPYPQRAGLSGLPHGTTQILISDCDTCSFNYD